MQACCCSLHTLQFDCWACAARLAPQKAASISSTNAKILMIRFPLGVETVKLGLRARCLVERGAQSPGKFQRIVMGPEMKEEQSRLFVQHVAMDGGHVDSACPQRLDHGIHLIARQNKVSGDSRLAAAGRLEVDSRVIAQRSYLRILNNCLHYRLKLRNCLL